MNLWSQYQHWQCRRSVCYWHTDYQDVHQEKFRLVLIMIDKKLKYQPFNQSPKTLVSFVVRLKISFKNLLWVISPLYSRVFELKFPLLWPTIVEFHKKQYKMWSYLSANIFSNEKNCSQYTYSFDLGICWNNHWNCFIKLIIFFLSLS